MFYQGFGLDHDFKALSRFRGLGFLNYSGPFRKDSFWTNMRTQGKGRASLHALSVKPSAGARKLRDAGAGHLAVDLRVGSWAQRRGRVGSGLGMGFNCPRRIPHRKPICTAVAAGSSQPTARLSRKGGFPMAAHREQEHFEQARDLVLSNRSVLHYLTLET